MPSFPLAPSPWGNATALDISSATVAKSSPGVLVSVQVITAGSTAGAAYDSTSTSGNTAANQVCAIPNTVGVYPVQMPCASGIVVSPGTGQVVAISYS